MNIYSRMLRLLAILAYHPIPVNTWTGTYLLHYSLKVGRPAEQHLSSLTSSQRGKYASDTERSKDNECYAHTF